ncbi:MAG: tripartite tricarboxylate transporter substrate binding protein [Synergistaceae bacterium]|nr:tripartite tricarboxylate transporter substrate binding protein [Synergistaceae bacterium]MBQ4401515.1 tripartite tricarboxylate transporter substrate binding protein [Synergistaceae bacterium]MBR0185930.1 tripartite tricarboxylate transporter substrate binding protein [Synergistaceae bacterium]
MKKVFAFALVFVMALSGASFAADWPTGTVNVVLPYGAGGDTDTYCRQLFQRVSKITGQTFVVINQQGGSGIVAAMDVLNKKPDGYTILFNHTGASLVQEATGMVDFSYTNSFENCCTVAIDETYSLVAISPEGEYKSYSKGWKTLADMIAYAKENPGKVRYSTVFGSTTEYVGTMLERQAGVEFDNINVGTSGGERMAAMLGGQVDILAANYMQVKDYIEKGDLVCLAVMSKQRVPGIDYPTFAELGYDKVVTAKKYEIKFPKGTDKAIVDKLAGICREIVLNDASYADVLRVYFAQPLYRDAEQMNKEDPEEVKELEAGLAAD